MRLVPLVLGAVSCVLAAVLLLAIASVNTILLEFSTFPIFSADRGGQHVYIVVVRHVEVGFARQVLSLLDRREHIHAFESSAIVRSTLRISHVYWLFLDWRMTRRQSLKWTLVCAVEARLDLACIDAVYVGVLVGRDRGTQWLALLLNAHVEGLLLGKVGFLHLHLNHFLLLVLGHQHR